MINVPKYLQQGDHIHILTPAKQIDEGSVSLAKKTLESAGFEVSISAHCLGQHHYFSGTTAQRLSDLQSAIDDPKIDAILCARGGYGCVQLVDSIDWSSMYQSPKWLIGFSDVTVLHNRLHQLDVASIHGTMPLNFSDHTTEAFKTLLEALTGATYVIKGEVSEWNQKGSVKSIITGGNLAIIASLIGTNDGPDYTGKILFLEEVGEPLYSVDRMFYHLAKAGILSKISGLIIGGMSHMKDSETPYGKSIEEIITQHTKGLKIPVAFGIPSGHIRDNQAIRFGSPVTLSVDDQGAEIQFL